MPELLNAAFPTALPLRQRIIILTLAIIVHGVLLAQPWPVALGVSSPAPRELSVSIARMPSSRPVSAASSSRPLPPPGEHKLSASAEPQSVMRPLQYDVVQSGALQPGTGQVAASYMPVSNNESAQSAASGLPDHEPDYRAAYLNNPQPEYPLAARRMGWQGRVVLNVEVLADGTSGEVVVQQSSGREILDSAAVRSVRGWRFVPARQGGHAIAQRLLVPVRFNLEMVR